MPHLHRILAAVLVSTAAAFHAQAANTGVAGMTEYEIPKNSGWVNVRDLGAKGDGVTDDTAAILSHKPESEHSVGTIYFPNGTYLLSDTIFVGSKRVIFQGESRDGVILKLKANSPGFGDSSAPKPFISTFGRFMDRKANMGQAFRNSVFDLTIEVGPGNPGAVALHYLANNQGGVENVAIRGQGKAGLGLVTNWPGPSLIRKVSIEGFDIGVWSLIGQYSMTFEDISLKGQKEFGIFNRGQALFIRGLKSENTVPAIRNTLPTTNIVVVDSQLTGGAPTNIAIDSLEAEPSKRYTFQKITPGVFLRNVSTSGYKQALALNRDGKTIDVKGGLVNEFSSIPAARLMSNAKTSLNLPVEDAPTVDLGDSANWVNLRDFTPGTVTIKDKTYQDWSVALQAAVDTGAEVIYLPRGDYNIFDTVELRGKIKAIMGMDSALKTDLWTDKPGPALRIVENGQPALLIDRLTDNYGKALIFMELAAKKTLIIRNSIFGRFRNTVPGGKVFLYDVCGANYAFDNLSVWARQFNPEASPKREDSFNIRVKGGSLWVLGLKTEYGKTVIEATDGAKVEVLGGWHYHDGEVGYINSASQMTIAGLLTSNGWFKEALIREIRGSQTKDLQPAIGKAEADNFNGGYRQYGTLVPLYLGN